MIAHSDHRDAGRASMSAAFFGLAFLAALNPKLLAVDLLQGDGWAQRALREPRFGLAILIGAVVGTPGASYITALHELITGKSSTAVQAIAIVIFTIIEFLLIIVPYVLLELRPEATKVKLKSAQAWLAGHARQVIAWAAIVAGAYMSISGVVRLT
jgi:Na+/phosphate symporter